uniref:Uncharacterized protein n=1 Tax=Anguilla anguilla TaxID=7936 RepID=A0A0E9VGH9_ANGAN
MLNYTLFPE